MRETPEGYEPAENSYAKDHAMAALESELEKQGVEIYEDDASELIDLIGLADAVVEALLKVGVTIPEDIPKLYGAEAGR